MKEKLRSMTTADLWAWQQIYRSFFTFKCPDEYKTQIRLIRNELEERRKELEK